MFAFRWKPEVTPEQKKQALVEIGDFKAKFLDCSKPTLAQIFLPGGRATSSVE